ncbi:MAG: hypothetical protein JO060_11785 [Candidatus Eremiobacteraeota bacterium]|nr:hypothetical protein [Candidatus Eremiobacteraeota bacterium]
MDSAELRRSGRVLRLAVGGSVLVHVLAFLLSGLFWSGIATLRPRAVPTPPDVVVTTSNTVTIERRTRPRPATKARSRTAQTPRAPEQRAQPNAIPQPLRVAQQKPPARPFTRSVAPSVGALHELAKAVPRAPPNAEKTVRATPPAAEETPPADTTSRGQASQPEQMHKAPAGQLSEERLAHINADIQKTLAQLRAEDNPLAVRSTPAPAGERRYHVEMLGRLGDLRHAQGSCYPIKSWTEDGYDYYYESCNVQFEDGHYEAQAVPWPIRYKVGHDLYHGDLGSVTVPLPPPLPGWKLPAGEHVSQELREYAHEQGVDI